MNALVIGGTRGFGKEVTKLLLKRGYRVTTIGRSKNSLANQSHYICDIGNLTAWKRTLKKITQNSPKINLVIFITGYARAIEAADLSPKDWYNHLNKNLIYVSLGLEALKDHLELGAKIATIGSQWSVKVGMEYLVPYTISKHALNALTQDFAQRTPSVKANHYCVPTMGTPQYVEMKQSFTEQGLNYPVKEIANSARIAKSFIDHFVNFEDSGKTFMINKDCSVIDYALANF